MLKVLRGTDQNYILEFSYNNMALKYFVFIILLCLSFFGTAQEKDIPEESFTDYYNYTPQRIEIDFNQLPKESFFRKMTAPISFEILRSLYLTKDIMKWTNIELQWLNSYTDAFALAMYLDGKTCLIEKTLADGDRLQNKQIQEKNIAVVVLQQASCSDDFDDQLFKSQFNAKMYQLMQIKAPDHYTYTMAGHFKSRHGSILKIKHNRSFEFWYQPNKHSQPLFYSGYWDNKATSLILKPNANSAENVPVMQLTYKPKSKKFVNVTPLGVTLKRIALSC